MIRQILLYNKMWIGEAAPSGVLAPNEATGLSAYKSVDLFRILRTIRVN